MNRPAMKTESSSEPERQIFADERAVLTAVGEVVYEWSLEDDRIRWGDNATAVLGVASLADIATGRGFAGILDPANPMSRYDAVLSSTSIDEGSGVSYQIQYAVLPEGRGTARRLWIEDIGRWYAGRDGRPKHAHGVLRVINDRHEREQRLAFLSRYDELTGFFNRSHLLATLGDALESAKRLRGSIAFMIVSIDNFMAINEAYGFDIADQIFAAAAGRIRSQLRVGDSIGRYTGNKLGLLLTDCDEHDMQAAAERYHAAIRNEVIATEAGSVAVTLSVGGATLPRHGRTISEAMTHAQEALHQARRRGIGRFVAFAPSPARDAERRRNAVLSSELVAALDDRRVRLAFQPIAEIASRATSFYEALIRVERVDGSLFSTVDLIPLAERLGLIRLIDHRVLELVLEAVVERPDATISINVSAETIGDSEWLTHLATILDGRRDVAGRLIIEITETAVIRHLDEACDFVARLHDLGCRVAIDDFGAGFSSFRTLRALDVDLIKIDGDFMKDLVNSPDDRVFVKTLVELARNFEIETVAEWVEDEETAALLSSWGVTHIQGHIVGPAVSPEGGAVKTADAPAVG